MKKVVFVNQSANYLAEDIVKAMLDSGRYDEVVMMVGNPENLKIKDERVIIKSICRYNRESFSTRAKSWVIGTVQCLWRLLTKYRSHELFLVSNPPTASFITLLCPNHYSTMIYDVYPDGLVSSGMVGRNNIVIKTWGIFNKRFFKKALAVFTITEGMADRISNYIDRNRIKVFPIWYNSILKRINRADNEFIKAHNLEDKFVVMYSGNIGKGHNVNLLVDVAERLRNNDRVKFVIIGEGWEKQSIVKRVEELKLSNVLILTYQPLDKISHSLSAADINYVSVDSWASTISIPSKTFNCLYLGSPILATSEPNAAITKLVDDNNVGRAFRNNDINAIAEYIEAISSDPKRLDALKQNAEKLSNDYSPRLATEIVASINDLQS